jgi:hypothetical protein
VVDRYLSTRDPEERARLLRDAASGAAAPAAPPAATRPRVPGKDERNEVVAFDEAMAWWQRPLLRSNDGGRAETVIVGSNAGGRTGSPSTSTSRVDIWYSPPGSDPRNDTYFDLLDAGAAIVTVVYYNDPSWLPQPQDGDEPVVVRGHQATRRTLHRPSANVDWRRVWWNEPLPDGGVLKWEIGTSPERFSDDEARAFADRLEVHRP